jgi:conjugal transfer pilus assembly protein TraV
MKTQNIGRLALMLAGVASLAACTSLSGLSGSSSFACTAPEGVTCQSVSGTYANAVANNLPAQRARSTPAAAPLPTPSAPTVPVASKPDGRNVLADAAPAFPLRSAPRILRLWFKPWEDADRDLYDQGYVYVQVDGGRWLVDHAQRAVREAYAPVRSPAGRAAVDPAPRPPNAGVQRPTGLDPLISGLPARPSAPASGDGPD